MKKYIYRFIGKPDKTFPHLKTGRVYKLEIEEVRKGFLWLEKAPVIVSPIQCPYSSWTAFWRNWQ